eukprot:531839_1
MRSTNGRKLIKQFHEILDQFKSAFSLIEKDKTPTIHLVLDVLDRIFNDFTATDETGQAHTFPSVIKANGADLMETKALRKEIRDTIDPIMKQHCYVLRSRMLSSFVSTSHTNIAKGLKRSHH